MTTPGGWPSTTHTPQPGDMAIPGGRTHDAQPQTLAAVGAGGSRL